MITRIKNCISIVVVLINGVNLTLCFGQEEKDVIKNDNAQNNKIMEVASESKYDLNQISQIIKKECGSFIEWKKRGNLNMVANIIFNNCSSEVGYGGGRTFFALQKDKFGSANIVPVTITEAELMKSFFWPRITFYPRFDWRFEFPAYLMDGSIVVYDISGESSEDWNLEVKKIEIKELYPKGSVKLIGN